MPRVCNFTGKGTKAGRTYTLRGKPKYLGGVGTKITGKSKRRFRANVQTVTAMVNGKPQRVKVSTKAMKKGLVAKPPRRKDVYRASEKQQASG
jgi:large subunit ribosomal protein L28